jgi:hypothetical protein
MIICSESQRSPVRNSEVKVADMAHSMLPDFLYPREPIWHCPGISEASQLLIVWRGGQRGQDRLDLFSTAASYVQVISMSPGRYGMSLPSLFFLFSILSSLCLNDFSGLKRSNCPA